MDNFEQARLEEQMAKVSSDVAAQVERLKGVLTEEEFVCWCLGRNTAQMALMARTGAPAAILAVTYVAVAKCLEEAVQLTAVGMGVKL